jgi:tetratricopeptide (TPR) repeat protein
MPPSRRAQLDAALTLLGKGRLGEARARLARLLHTYPDDVEIQLRLGGVLQASGRHDEALPHFADVLRRLPDLDVAAIGLARAWRELDETKRAGELLKWHLVQSPSSAPLITELASLRHFEHAFETAIRLNTYLTYLTPTNALPHANIAENLAELQREAEALHHIEVAIELDPGSAQLRLNSAFTLLALGRYKEGWTAYESRLAPEIPDSPRRLLDIPRWRGEPLRDKHILVCSEQGTGDQFFFGAYIPWLQSQAAMVTVETDPRLVELFQRSLPKASVRPYSRRVSGVRPHFSYGWLPSGLDRPNYYIDLASLPLLLGDNHEHPVSATGYLTPDQNKVTEWRARLADLSAGRPVVGVFWRSGLITPARAKFYPVIERWEPLLTLPEVCFVSLQFDDDSEDIETARRLFGASILKLEGIDLRDDLDHLAALCGALDGVVAPSTTTANLSSAIATRTVIVDRTRSWPPMIGDKEAILNATERVFPPNQGDWDWVFRETRRRVLSWFVGSDP